MKKIDISENIREEYELISEIKAGGNSELFLLYDRVCGRKVLMKSGRLEFIENEARLMSRLSGKGVPDVYGCFEYNGKAYLYRQYIEGRSLRESMASDGAFSAEKTINIGIEVCGIISRLHSSEPPVIHRDIKSDNIIISDNDEIFIIDFGISREYDSSVSRDTLVMGTPITAPPEQFGYGQTDERSDVYAIGILLNELVTGSEKLNLSELPRELASIIERCTEFSPEKRFRNADECRKALLKKQKGSYKLLTFVTAACAAVVATIFILLFNGRAGNISDTSVTEPKEKIIAETDNTEPVSASALLPELNGDGKLFVELDSEYAGDFEYSSVIPKNILDAFDGDIEIELDVETVEEGGDGNYHMLVPVNADDRWEKLTVSSLHERGDDGKWLIVSKGHDTCKFTVSRETVEMLGDNGIVFQIYNLIIKSASVGKADKGIVYEYEKVTDTKIPYTIELDDEYQGDYALSKNIPKSLLESYEGDIKITLDIEVGGLYNYANFIPIALVGDAGAWKNLTEEIECEYNRNRDGFIEIKKDQTECTLILSHDAVEMIGEHGIGFKAVNITFKSASLVDA